MATNCSKVPHINMSLYGSNNLLNKTCLDVEAYANTMRLIHGV